MIEEEIKAAILNRDFETAQQRMGIWGRSVMAALQTASGDSERNEIYSDAISFADSSTHLTRVMRAHIATDLQANSTLFLYRSPELEHHRWNLEA